MFMEMPGALEVHAHAALAFESGRLRQASDHALLDYRLRIEPAFDCLRDALSQTAAVLLLIASGSRDAIAHPMLAVVESHEHEVREALFMLEVPAVARHGHTHMLASLNALQSALRGIRSVCVSDATDAIYEALQRGLRELRFAACLVPGLEIVSGAQSCACHAQPAKAE